MSEKKETRVIRNADKFHRIASLAYQIGFVEAALQGEGTDLAKERIAPIITTMNAELERIVPGWRRPK